MCSTVAVDITALLNIWNLICEHKLLYITSKVTAPQDAHKRLVLQVYLGSNTLEFSDIHIGKMFVSRL